MVGLVGNVVDDTGHRVLGGGDGTGDDLLSGISRGGDLVYRGVGRVLNLIDSPADGILGRGSEVLSGLLAML